jgi:molybdopterin molybdotransferase
MLTFQAARKIILDSVSPCGTERVGVLDALGRVLAEDVISPWDLPAADNSAMDGFAVIAADCQAPTALPVVGHLQAGGAPPSPMVAGTAVRIMTGACIPEGCDAVVPIEETEDLGGKVGIRAPIARGQHVRTRGQDVGVGERILARGTVVRSPEISMLASCGRALVPVFRRPRVAILSTGDELVELGEPLAPGKIINSNALSLAAAVREAGAEPSILGIARDDRASHRERMCEGLRADALITSAGVSAGDHDHVRDVLEELGVTQRFWKVAMKPGGPTAFGTSREGRPVFSLPGNPVSTMVTFEIFVRPALLRVMGRRRVVRPTIRVRLAEDVRKKPGKVQLVRLTLGREGDAFVARSSGDQNTGILKTMIQADAMAILPAEREAFAAGEEVEAMVLRDDVGFLEG